MPDHACATLDVLVPRREEVAVFATSASVGPVALYTGVAHAAIGDAERAEEDLRVAVAHADRGLAGPWGILARLELSRVLTGAVGAIGSEASELIAVARREGAASGSPELDRLVQGMAVSLVAEPGAPPARPTL